MNIETVTVNFGGVTVHERREWYLDDDAELAHVIPRWLGTIRAYPSGERPSFLSATWILGTGQQALEAWL